MTKQVEMKPEGKKIATHLLFIISLLILPGTWGLFGSISLFLPLTAFVFINKYGWRYTNKIFVISIFAATLLSFFLQTVELTLFSIAILPTGYVIAKSAQQREAPWLAGLKGSLFLGATLSLFFGILLFDTETSFFALLSQSIDRATEEALNQYRQSDNISSESYLILEQTLHQMRYFAPKVMPAILACLLCVVTWTTLVLGNTILPRFCNTQPWPGYKYWSLPDKLIWAVIVSGILVIIPSERLNFVGINVLIVLALVYCFKGLAILVFLLEKWNVPRIWRSVIYLLMILQSFGTVLLLGLGIADIWLNIRSQEIQGVDKSKTE